MTCSRPSEMILALAEDVAAAENVSDREWRAFLTFTRAHGLPSIDLPHLGMQPFEFLTQTEAATLFLFVSLLRSGASEPDAACAAVLLAKREGLAGETPAVIAAFDKAMKVFGAPEVARMRLSVQIEGA